MTDDDLDTVVIAELESAADEVRRYADDGAPTTAQLLGWAAVMRAAVVRLHAHSDPPRRVDVVANLRLVVSDLSDVAATLQHTLARLSTLLDDLDDVEGDDG